MSYIGISSYPKVNANQSRLGPYGRTTSTGQDVNLVQARILVPAQMGHHLPMLTHVVLAHGSVEVSITSLPDPNLRVRKPLMVTVQAVNDEFMASLVGADISVYGETASGSVLALRDYVTRVYKRLSGAPALGKAMQAQLRFLEMHIGQ